MTEKAAKDMAAVIAPLIRKGQSPYTIINNHPELGICEKTLYNYIEGGLFEFSGSNQIIALDLRRQASRKISKKAAAQYKKRADRKFLKGREYTDYQAYIAENGTKWNLLFHFSLYIIIEPNFPYILHRICTHRPYFPGNPYETGSLSWEFPPY